MQGRHYLFFEDYQYARQPVLISWSLHLKGRASRPQVALETDCHLSYPFVFVHAGEVYMIPETGQRNRIELWRAERFPDRWVFDRVLIDAIGAVDTTWLHYQGRYWLFVGVAAEVAGSDELHLFSSDGPLGPWRPHQANPVATSIRGARPAGRPVVRNGQLIRPGQDGGEGLWPPDHILPGRANGR